jgi:hypothetical protein
MMTTGVRDLPWQRQTRLERQEMISSHLFDITSDFVNASDCFR